MNVLESYSRARARNLDRRPPRRSADGVDDDDGVLGGGGDDVFVALSVGRV